MGYMEKQGGGALTVFHMNPSVNPSRIYLRYEYRFDKPEESTMLVNVPVFAEWVAKTMRMDIRQVKDWLVERGYFTGEQGRDGRPGSLSARRPRTSSRPSLRGPCDCSRSERTSPWRT